MPGFDFPPWVASDGREEDERTARNLSLQWLCEPPESGSWLQRVDGRLCLCRRDTAPFHVDLESERVRSAGRKDALPRAIGLHRRSGLDVVDGTAGWGTDAATLARLGAEVIAVERHPALFALLADGLTRVEAEWSHRLSLRLGEAGELLQEPGRAPGVILLDPMFPDRGGSQVRKGAQILRQLARLPTDDESRELLALAREAAGRVVVKRHRHAPPLADAPPSFTVEGQRVRFDVYLAPTES